MTVSERVRWLRKSERVGLTLEKFGARLGVTKVAVSNIENGNRALTEQMLLAICREFGVREEWLRDGTGEPFVQLSRDEQIEEFVKDILKEKPEAFRRRFVSTMAALDVEEWEMIEKILEELFESQIGQEEAPPAADDIPDDLRHLPPDEAVLVMRRREEKRRAEGSGVTSAM